ncbi:MAG: ribosome small subunit-dependent GTPase A [Bacteroidales bacterium]|nr:ribosome small subunit-dependent GTPase A [Bacteroidales bacterium]
MEKKGIATIVKHTGSHYLLSELPEWNLFPAIIRGKMRLKSSSSTNPIAVGDKVEYIIDMDSDEPMGMIKNVLPRKNYIIRKSTNLSRQSHIIAANLDLVFLVVTLVFPETKLAFIDRFLLTCEAYKIHVIILLNKIDLYKEEYKEQVTSFKKIYEGAGYEILEISALKNENIDLLREKCKGNISLFSGVSGVGKSSIIKALDPSLSPKISEISQYHLQGKHTTTFYEMHPIQSGGFIIDTPGIKGFGIVDIKVEELSTYFPEMLKVMDNCHFKPCTHTHEPGCAVKAGVENGTISPERYYSYLGMLEEETKYRQ